LASDAVLGWLPTAEGSLSTLAPVWQVIFVQPLNLAILQGGYVVLYIVLLRRGNRDQAAALAETLGAEAATGRDVVTAEELPVLLNPAKRLFLRVIVLRRYGLAAWRALRGLQHLQYELGMRRWYPDDGEPSDDELVAAIAAARDRLATACVAAASGGPATPPGQRTPGPSDSVGIPA
jgi:hypothetical protein